eukprot:scaffold232791_cov38-Prasinocladus_malaysianus.AAC.1
MEAAAKETWSMLHGLFDEPRLVPQDCTDFEITVAGRKFVVRQRFDLQAQGIAAPMYSKQTDASGVRKCTEQHSRTGSILWDRCGLPTRAVANHLNTGTVQIVKDCRDNYLCRRLSGHPSRCTSVSDVFFY